MTAVGFAYFVGYFLLAAGLIRFIELTWPDSMVGRALGVLH